jgi:hypothetical protein
MSQESTGTDISTNATTIIRNPLILKLLSNLLSCSLMETTISHGPRQQGSLSKEKKNWVISMTQGLDQQLFQKQNIGKSKAV